MNISIVVAVYNEPVEIRALLESVKNLAYPRDAFELVLVNDGSTDGTGDSINNWINTEGKDISINYITLPNNQGRIVARKRGVEAARYDTVLITDARCTLAEDALFETSKLSHLPANGNPIMRGTSLAARFFFLIRARMYPHSVGDSFPDHHITADNFDRVSKGTTIFITPRDLFLRSSMEAGTSKYANDDTKILRSMVNETSILKTSRVRCFYKGRPIEKEIRHMFERGPRFVDYYYHPHHRFFYAITAMLLFIPIVGVLVVSGYGIVTVGGICALLIVASAVCARSIQDFFICLVCIPLLGAAFIVGCMKGLLLKLFRRY